MNKRLCELAGEPLKNYIYPFFWPDEDAPEQIAEEVEAVYRSGCGGLCLEARPFEDFGGKKWWHTAETVLEEAKKRGMKVWILDDKHFPTGYANGYIKSKYPNLRRHWLFEHHLDIHGPKSSVSVRIPVYEEDEKIIFACAYRRTGKDEELTREPIKIELNPGARFVSFDLPEGLWRVFFVVDSAHAEHRGKGWHIDMLSEESSAVLIEAVYEEHYKHLGKYFGNTLEGFFSDEPCFGAEHTECFGYSKGTYYRTVGQPGISLPWNETVIDEIGGDREELLSRLPALWYSHGEYSPDIRFRYMDAVTKLWNRNFSKALGNWCRAHGVIYTGHVIEDLNAHSRLGGSAGHYFRALEGQDISGIDIVLHQVMPGMADYITSASVQGGIADGNFYHYTLAQLGSSLARINPGMKGRAMCELFGAFGWAESTPFMKWMADFLMIRGINHFVPHAFSVKYPFDDCPPHFYAKGCNPQFAGFSELMKYMNRVSALLDGAVRQTPGAVLYYAENEWLNTDRFEYCDRPAKALYDSHIDYDILPIDALEKGEVRDGKLFVNGIGHSFLVIPEAERYTEKLTGLVRSFEKAGLPVFTAVSPEKDYGSVLGQRAECSELGKIILDSGLAFDYGVPASKLRIGRFDRESEKIFYFFNEEPVEKIETVVTLPTKGDYSELSLLNGGCFGGFSADGKVKICLEPGESIIFVFDGEKSAFGARPTFTHTMELIIKWNVETEETGLETGFKPYKQTDELFNINALNELPDFSGRVRYTGSFVHRGGGAVLNLGEVGYTAELKINGIELPMRISAPYRWDISSAVREGENTVEIITANTLCNRVYDDLSTFMFLTAEGLIGPVTLITEDENG